VSELISMAVVMIATLAGFYISVLISDWKDRQ
jgi:hypothetical protein